MREVTLTIQHDDDEVAEEILADEIERLMEYIEGRTDELVSASEITAAVIITAKAMMQAMEDDSKARLN